MNYQVELIDAFAAFHELRQGLEVAGTGMHLLTFLILEGVQDGPHQKFLAHDLRKLTHQVQ
jgi:hypothetical protein